MSNQNPIYSCQRCAAQYPKWQGRCNECGHWGSLLLDESFGDVAGEAGKAAKNAASKLVGKIKLTSLEDLSSELLSRLKSNLNQIDALLGGGIVPGSLILLAGEPGIGKSTLVLQLVESINPPLETLYIAGEESGPQIKNRLDRLGLKPRIKFLSQPTLEKGLAAIEQAKPSIVIVDSIQTLGSEQVGSAPGNLSQVRACTSQLLETCKKLNTSCFIIGHVTKDGLVAGPKSLEHLVDTVLYLEGDQLQNFRILRVTKNRFGPTDEVVVLQMSDKGLKPVENPSAIFLGDTSVGPREGCVVTAILDGSKTFLIEIQALVSQTSFGFPQRRCSGFDNNRLQLLLAVLTKRAKLNQLNNCDVHINIAGGYKVKEPAADLAICLAVVSSLLNKKIDQASLVFGEVGLGGELRQVKRPELRIKEAAKLGYSKIISPGTVKFIDEAINFLK